MQALKALTLLLVITTVCALKHKLRQNIQQEQVAGASYAYPTCQAGYVPVCLVNPCTTNPCLHGGSCLGTSGVAVCTCATGYAGSTCASCAANYIQVSGKCIVNPCTTNPCLNGGSCLGTSGSAVCTCATGYAGSTCTSCATNYIQVSGKCIVNPCVTNNPCLNGGSCAGTSGTAVCTCVNNHIGLTCATCSANLIASGANCLAYSGSYINSCNSCSLSVTTLTCSCRQTNGSMDSTSLNLTTCGSSLSSIDNDNGHLQCASGSQFGGSL